VLAGDVAVVAREREDVEQRGLAGAGGAHDGMHLARGEGEVDLLENAMRLGPALLGRRPVGKVLHHQVNAAELLGRGLVEELLLHLADLLGLVRDDLVDEGHTSPIALDGLAEAQNIEQAEAKRHIEE